MARKLRFQHIRSDRSRRKPEMKEKWVLEPIDGALVAIIAALIIWLHWLLAAMPS